MPRREDGPAYPGQSLYVVQLSSNPVIEVYADDEGDAIHEAVSEAMQKPDFRADDVTLVEEPTVV